MEFLQFNLSKIINNPKNPVLVFEIPNNLELIKKLDKSFY